MSKVLIIGPSWVGDMVMSQSLFKRLKEQDPELIIDVLAPGWCKPILERMPEVRHALEMPLEHGAFDIKTRYSIGRQLRTEQYDRAYVIPRSAKSALVPFFARIPKRIGWKGEMRYGLLNDIRPNRNLFKYMVERLVALAHPKKEMVDSSSLGGLSTLPIPKLTVNQETQQQALHQLALNLDNPVIGLCPGAEFGPAKQWPTKHYAEVAQHAVKQGYQVWLFGSKKDHATCEEIVQFVGEEQRTKLHNLAGATSLIQAVDLLGACKTVVSNDSGLMHVAAAVGCHVIGIYGSTSPDYTPPLTDKVNIVSTDIECRPCFQRQCPLGHLRCLTDLSSQHVISLIVPIE